MMNNNKVQVFLPACLFWVLASLFWTIDVSFGQSWDVKGSLFIIFLLVVFMALTIKFVVEMMLWGIVSRSSKSTIVPREIAVILLRANWISSVIMVIAIVIQLLFIRQGNTFFQLCCVIFMQNIYNFFVFIEFKKRRAGMGIYVSTGIYALLCFVMQWYSLADYFRII